MNNEFTEEEIKEMLSKCSIYELRNMARIFGFARVTLKTRFELIDDLCKGEMFWFWHDLARELSKR